jgi:hypothetical protein
VCNVEGRKEGGMGRKDWKDGGNGRKEGKKEGKKGKESLLNL